MRPSRNAGTPTAANSTAGGCAYDGTCAYKSACAHDGTGTHHSTGGCR